MTAAEMPLLFSKVLACRQNRDYIIYKGKNNMARLIVPELNELNYRKKLLENRGTMAFRNGIIPFPKEEWSSFHQEWVGQDPGRKYFAYIYCGGCEDFTGMVSYCYDEELAGHVIDVLVEKSRRRCGYGTSGISLIKDIARQNHISRFIAPLPKDSEAIPFLEKNGFQKDHESEDSVVYVLDF